MNDLDKMHKRDGGAGSPLGIATVFPFLTAADEAGVQVGLAEFGPGQLPFDQSYAEGIFVLDGEIEITQGQACERVGAGEFLWLPRGGQVVYSVRERCRYLFIIPPAPVS